MRSPARVLLAFLVAIPLAGSTLLAQSGDKAGEAQPDLPDDLNIEIVA